MHAAAFASLGLPHRYLAFHVAPERLPAALAGARALGFGGLNLTVPHKQAALACVDELTATARRIGAINTIEFTARGMVGDNTDSPGFAAAARELDAAPVRSATVLGAGGAALAVLDAIVRELRVPGGELRWICRDPGALAPVLAARPWLAAVVRPSSYTALEVAPLTSELLVNCTTIGMRGGPSVFPVPLDLTRLPAGARVIDAVYPRPVGGLLDRAAALGHRTQDGLPMLLWQGVRALERWLAHPLPDASVAAMRAALGG